SLGTRRRIDIEVMSLLSYRAQSRYSKFRTKDLSTALEATLKLNRLNTKIIPAEVYLEQSPKTEN
ncbi:MAG: hypothetical protein KDD16_10570, partial [Mangrovimonas sp.]|nr:hypothetical protein [Mangrovimonas sp.]